MNSKMLRLILKYIFPPLLILTLTSCVPASDDDFDVVKIDHIPLKTGNKWIYEITRGGESFTDSAEILDYYPYQVDELTNRYLFQYKEIPFTLEMAVSDTLWINLVEYDNDRLIQYGCEKRDNSGFPYGSFELFTESRTILDHNEPNSNILYSDQNEYIESVAAEEMFVGSIEIIDKGIMHTLADTTINCIRVRHQLSSGSFITTDLNYDLNFYYTGFGVLKIEGTVNSSAFSATAVSCTLK